MKYVIKIVIVGLVFFAAGAGTTVTAQTDTEPRRIMINPLEPGNTGVAITWRNALNVEENVVQWGPAHPHPINDLSDFNHQKADSRLDTATYEGKTEVYKSFRANLPDLQPGQEYLYRVGSGEKGWSEWIQFDLPGADPDSALTFIYLGDPQNDLKSQWSRTVRQAYATAPDASFILYAGDLVNRGYNDREWKDWYEAGDFIHRMIPSIMTPGNHEYEYPDLTPLWRTNFTFPGNGPEGYDELYGACYYIDYPAVRVISLDGTTSENDEHLRSIQAEWLEKVLENTDKKWIILTLHQPFYSTKETRDNPQIRDAYRSLVEQHGVDIILQGHDHAYGRGMLDEGASRPGHNGIMYVVSVSGPKMYEIGEGKNWIQKQRENTQLYQVITIRDDQLYFKSYTATGDRSDEFTLEKTPQGNVLQ
ncbi:metallophosphoesterase [Fodinibius sp.]|uniref:metallophosphoesterase n=1 Tax=Fodinibius sp. TaxID=1872440 RepID=UPI0035680C5A